MVAESGFRNRAGRILREVIAPIAWLYGVVKLTIFDIDMFALHALTPQWQWILDFKFFGLLAVAVFLLIFLGQKEFLTLLAYVLGYPLVVLFWQVPKLLLRRWPLAIAFSPAVFAGITRLRTNFLLYAVLAFSALFILCSSSRVLIVICMVSLGLFLATHLYRSLRKAYSASLFTQLVGLTKKLREAIEGGTFAPWETKTPPTSSDASGANPAPPDAFVGIYLLHGLAHIVASKVKAVAKARYYDLYLAASWLYTVLVTAAVYGLAYFGLQKAYPDAFDNAAGAGFWSFFGFSVGMLTTRGVSLISPASATAMVLSYSEVLCSIVILVILVFSILTAAREAFRDDLDDFATEVQGVAGALEARATLVWHQTFLQLEFMLLTKSPAMVKWLRKTRGVGDIETGPAQLLTGGDPPKDPEKSGDSA